MSAPNLSVMLTMVLKPSSLGSGPMKLIATESNLLSGIGNECSGSAHFEVVALLH